MLLGNQVINASRSHGGAGLVVGQIHCRLPMSEMPVRSYKQSFGRAVFSKKRRWFVVCTPQSRD